MLFSLLKLSHNKYPALKLVMSSWGLDHWEGQGRGTVLAPGFTRKSCGGNAPFEGEKNPTRNSRKSWVDEFLEILVEKGLVLFCGELGSIGWSIIVADDGWWVSLVNLLHRHTYTQVTCCYLDVLPCFVSVDLSDYLQLLPPPPFPSQGSGRAVKPQISLPAAINNESFSWHWLSILTFGLCSQRVLVPRAALPHLKVNTFHVHGDRVICWLSLPHIYWLYTWPHLPPSCLQLNAVGKANLLTNC